LARDYPDGSRWGADPGSAIARAAEIACWNVRDPSRPAELEELLIFERRRALGDTSPGIPTRKRRSEDVGRGDLFKPARDAD